LRIHERAQRDGEPALRVELGEGHLGPGRRRRRCVGVQRRELLGRRQPQTLTRAQQIGVEPQRIQLDGRGASPPEAQLPGRGAGVCGGSKGGRRGAGGGAGRGARRAAGAGGAGRAGRGMSGDVAGHFADWALVGPLLTLQRGKLARIAVGITRQGVGRLPLRSVRGGLELT